MSANPHPAGYGGARTDFGRETSGQTSISLAAALREHAGRMARAEAMRYQFAMGLVGFAAGLTIVIPMVLWLAPQHGSILPGATAAQAPAVMHQAVAADSMAGPALVSVPTIAVRAPLQEEGEAEIAVASGQAGLAADDPVELARGLIRSGDIIAARRVLGRPELRQSPQALFMLAETYDPNVLAALGAMGVHAETSMARRYYEAALAEGVVAASPRLEALE